jgi:hypothetical protein
LSERSLAHPAQRERTQERQEAEKRFGAASRTYYLLAPADRHGLPGGAAGACRAGDRSLGEEATGAVVTPEQPYLYPHPLTLARDHAEAERIRLADSAAYSSMCTSWGRLGGLTTYYRYGPSWFRLLALRRWERNSPAELEAARERL